MRKAVAHAIMVVFMVILATLVFGMVTATSLCQGGCFVIGNGHHAHGDSFGGNVMGMKDGSIRGEWQHTFYGIWTNEELFQFTFHGYANILVAWSDGGPGPDVPLTEPNRAVFGGAGTWQGEPGYLWIVAVADYKEGADADDATRRDAYAITIYYDTDGDGIATASDEIVYQWNDCISSGNIQIFPTNGGHPYIPCVITAEMDRIASTMKLCPGS